MIQAVGDIKGSIADSEIHNQALTLGPGEKCSETLPAEAEDDGQNSGSKTEKNTN